MHVDVNNRLKSPFVCNPYTTLQTEDCKQRIGLTKNSSDADAIGVPVGEDGVVELVDKMLVFGLNEVLVLVDANAES